MEKPSHVLILFQAAPSHFFPKVRKGPHFFAEMGMVAQELVQFCYDFPHCSPGQLSIKVL